MRYRDPYQLFPKKLKSGKIVYYYTTYDMFNRRKQFSTGCTKKTEAKKYCLNLLLTDSLTGSPTLTFKQYTKKWYVYGECKYIESILNRGRTYSRSNSELFRAKLVNKMWPYFGNILMTDIKPLHLEEWIIILKKEGLTNVTINTYLSAIKTIFNEAYRLGDITKNPVTHIKRLATDSKSKGTLTTSEVEKLLDPINKGKIWSKDIYYIFTLIASQTGMRIGELLALTKKDIKRDHIIVSHSWDRKYGLKETKTGKSRIVPISQELYSIIMEYSSRSIHNYIFAKTTQDKPIANYSIRKAFYKALDSINITKQEREERSIDFHSWRRYYNTRLVVKGYPTAIIQAILGHSRDSNMTEHYTKLTIKDLSIVIDN